MMQIINRPKSTLYPTQINHQNVQHRPGRDIRAQSAKATQKSSWASLGQPLGKAERVVKSGRKSPPTNIVR